MKYLISFVLIISIASCSATSQIPTMTKEATLSTEVEANIINEGIKLHDEGRYEDAIAKYNEVLDANPENLEALYELSYSYFSSGKSQLALEKALKGMEYKSNLFVPFSIIAGSAYDELGEPESAINLYMNALEMAPYERMLHYNLGITYSNLGKVDEAESEFIKELEFNPNHPSTHFALTNIYMERKDQIVSLLLALRFLTLEPVSQRAVTEIQNFEGILSSGVEVERPQKINISVMLNDDSEKSIFYGVEFLYKITRATRYTEENKGKSEMEYRLSEIPSVIESVSELNIEESENFLEKYLIQFYKDLHSQNFDECLVYFSHQIVDDENVQNWIKANGEKINEFAKWAQNYGK